MVIHQPNDVDPALVDFAVLADWMDRQGLAGGPFEKVEHLAGGTQNVLLRFTRDGRDFVLRRGPRHLRPRSNDVMRREIRFLEALNGSGVPVPELIAACVDEHVMGGAVFYLVEPVDGFNPTTILPDLHRSDSGIRRQMGLEAAIVLARLGEVDHVAAGLGDVGRPDGFLRRQVPRWRRELESYDRYEGYPGFGIPGVEATARWLDAHRPPDQPPGILHGDYHLANLMYAFDGPQVMAIVDWEMCTIGDPLLDLGWLLAAWPGGGSDEDLGGEIGQVGGLPTRVELAEAYSRHTSRDLDAVMWYTVLACFKLGIVLEGTRARACAGMAAKEVGDRLHTITLTLFSRAREFIRDGHV